MQNPSSADHRKGAGRQFSFQIKEKRKRTAIAWMKRRVDSPLGKQIYSHRMSVVEPVFGNIGTNKGLNRFSLCGKEKVQGQYPKRFMGQALAVVLHDTRHRKANEAWSYGHQLGSIRRYKN